MCPTGRYRPSVAKARRFRLTRATARIQKETTLVDSYESAQTVLREQRNSPGSIGPMMFAKARREKLILRNELLRRGFEADALDYDGQAHMEETLEDLDAPALVADKAAAVL
jgi:hypothetical protein